MKEKTAVKKELATNEIGDAYCFVGIERHTKLILAWHLGKRDGMSTIDFMENVKRSTRGNFQLSTDGFRAYPEVVAAVLEGRADHLLVDGVAA